MLSGNSPWDRWVHDRDSAAVSDAVRRGGQLFEGKARCTACHVGSVFSDAPFDLYHKHRRRDGPAGARPGSVNVTKRDGDRGAFKTPILRNVAETAPYMHDGRLKTLEAAG
ncbi:MAG: hypothetical protein HY705_09245 [Gemmatimonadetes bacterium]|nr:hypothetical protein [Gemmatimonadota bacterium]